MLSLLRHLWTTRDRPPAGSTDWWKAWARRCRQLPALVKQAWFYTRLASRGAQLQPSVFFSDATLIEGRLDMFSAGEQSFIGRAELAVHAPLTIGRFVCINDEAKLLTASHDIRDPHWPTVARPIVVEDYAWIATNAMILPGVTIGRGAVVAAGAVVGRDVPAGSVAKGNPAQVLGGQRASELDYSPVAHLALFTAWRKLPIRSTPQT